MQDRQTNSKAKPDHAVEFIERKERTAYFENNLFRKRFFFVSARVFFESV